MILSYILMFFNVIFFYWVVLCCVVWVSEHEGELSCYFVPPIFLLVSFISCLVSLVVYNNFLFNISSPC